MAKQKNNSISDDAIEVKDLSMILSMPVQGAAAEPSFTLDEDEPIVTADLEEEPEHTPAEEVPGSGTQADSNPESLGPDDIAIIAVNILDGLQRFGFAFARKKFMFTAEEIELINGLDTDPKTVYPAGSTEGIAMKKYRKHLETIKKLPFDPGEKKRLTDATKIYARTMDMKVTPLQGLVLAYSEVLGTRAIMVFNE